MSQLSEDQNLSRSYSFPRLSSPCRHFDRRSVVSHLFFLSWKLIVKPLPTSWCYTQRDIYLNLKKDSICGLTKAVDGVFFFLSPWAALARLYLGSLSFYLKRTTRA